MYATKINIVGTCGAGKTFLSKRISSLTGVGVVDLDKYFIDFDKISVNDVVHYSEAEVLNKISKILKTNSWILEGIFPINDVLDQATTVVFVKPGLAKSIYYQWKRYFLDKYQRITFGFLNNVVLSLIIFRQHVSRKQKFRLGDFEYPTVVGWESQLRSRSAKAVVLKSNREINEYLSNFSN